MMSDECRWCLSQNYYPDKTMKHNVNGFRCWNCGEINSDEEYHLSFSNNTLKQTLYVVDGQMEKE